MKGKRNKNNIRKCLHFRRLTCASCSALRTAFSTSAWGSPTQSLIFFRSAPVKYTDLGEAKYLD